MTYKKYIKSLLIFTGIIIISTLLITLLYHKNMINSNTKRNKINKYNYIYADIINNNYK